METKVQGQKGDVPEWFTAEKLEELRPAIEASAQALVEKKVAARTPEFRGALRQLRERKAAPRD